MTTGPRSDFGDWLSPMLVKELRQGIRSKAFMAAFCLTQVLMILSVVLSLTAASDGAEGGRTAITLNVVFWMMVGVPLIFFMPMRGFNAIFGEIKGGTLEQVFLTRLSALRIAAGKWTALMVQALLIVTAVLPYVVLRYFLGGVNVAGDLLGLFFLFLACGILTAATLAISPYESKLLRSLFSIGMVLGFLFLLLGGMSALSAWMMMGTLGGVGGPSAPGWIFYLGIALFAPAFIVLGLEMGASRIAPPAENHATRKRLLALLLLGFATTLTLLGAPAEAAFGLALVLVSVVVIDALGETHWVTRSLYRPFFRRGPAGRLAAVFFAPGWVSAAWFLALLAGLGGLLLWWFGQLDDPYETLQYVAFFGWLVFPAAVIRVIVPTTRYFLGVYIAQQFFYGMVTFLVSLIANITDQPLTMWLCPLPPCAFLLSAFDQVRSDQNAEFLIVTGIVTALSLGALLARTVRPLRDIRAAMAQSDRQDG